MRFLRRRKAAPTTTPTLKPEGTLVPSPLRRHRVYRLDRVDESYQIWHGVETDERIDVHSFGGSWHEVIDSYWQRERDDDIAQRTLRTGAPRDMCRLGWHRSSAGLWFQLANAGVPGRLVVYYVGRRPERCFCTALKSFEGRTLRCTVCDQEVAKTTRQDP